MLTDRRNFCLAIACGTALFPGCGAQLPASPTPTPITLPQPVPTPTQSEYGTIYRSGFAGIEGTIEEVLRAAKLNPTVNKNDLLTALDGRSAPTIPGWDPENGFYVILVRGEYFGSGSVREVRLKPGDAWSLLDWNGKI